MSSAFTRHSSWCLPDRWQNMKLLILVTLTFQYTVGQMTPELAKKILDKHNEYRRMESSSDMYLLHWNVSLQERADGWLQRCEFDHEYIRDVGENLYFDADHENDVLLRGLEAWHVEKSHWGYTDGHCVSSCHFTQLVWAYTTTVGCSAKVCPILRRGTDIVENAMFFACYYYPRGNYLGNFPYKRGLACSECADGDTCSNELCVSTTIESKNAPEIVKWFKPRRPLLPHRPIKRLAEYQALEQVFGAHSSNLRRQSNRQHRYRYSYQLPVKPEATSRVTITKIRNHTITQHRSQTPLHVSGHRQLSELEHRQASRQNNNAKQQQSHYSHSNRRRETVTSHRQNRQETRTYHQQNIPQSFKYQNVHDTKHRTDATLSRRLNNRYRENVDNRNINQTRYNRNRHPYATRNQIIHTTVNPVPFRIANRYNVTTHSAPRNNDLATRYTGLYPSYHHRTEVRDARYDNIRNRIPQNRINNQVQNPLSAGGQERAGREDRNRQIATTTLHPNIIDDSTKSYYRHRYIIGDTKSSDRFRLERKDDLLHGKHGKHRHRDIPHVSDRIDRRQEIGLNRGQNVPHKEMATIVQVRYSDHGRHTSSRSQTNAVIQSVSDNRPDTGYAENTLNGQRVHDPSNSISRVKASDMMPDGLDHASSRNNKNKENNRGNVYAILHSTYQPENAKENTTLVIKKNNSINKMSENKKSRQHRELPQQNETVGNRKRGGRSRRRNRANKEALQRLKQERRERRRRERKERKRRQKEAEKALRKHQRRAEKRRLKLLLKEKKRRERLAKMEQKMVARLRRKNNVRSDCVDKVAGCSKRKSTCESSELVQFYCPFTCGLCKTKPRRQHHHQSRGSSSDNEAETSDINSTLRLNERHRVTRTHERTSHQGPQSYYTFREDRNRSSDREISHKSHVEGSRSHAKYSVERTTRKPGDTRTRGAIVPGIVETSTCRDDPRYSVGCKYWAKQGHCTKNKRIESFCKRSCGTCP